MYSQKLIENQQRLASLDSTILKVKKLREEYKSKCARHQDEFHQLEMECHSTQQKLAIVKRNCDTGRGTEGLGDTISECTRM